MKQSAGILLFRRKDQQVEFFLVHPGGPFFAKKDLGFWTVPKGELNEDEESLTAAIREFKEETGQSLTGNFIELTSIIQKGGKKVLCWAVEGDLDPSTIVSNTFEIEWPPRSGKKQSFAEIDKANWFAYADAVTHINEKQIALLDELKLKLSR
ncbi:NUDIX domain-containing protein [Pedobacter sp. KBS0701]|uniref:NUDIX domain-containing protein n=1 Tax=Pedobacter sp. KBS0701 TaxID=2578106 RepID=UPI00110D4B65|nr:NUDIX domain-containing protein [Pedobacter sp. KBS0701]QDW23514.1 NUDIX domain-containing protein [Pedobacter sp. KBS0701]